MNTEIEQIYSCFDKGEYYTKQIILFDDKIQINTKKADSTCSSFIVQEEIQFHKETCCIKNYQSYRNHLKIESFSYSLGKCFTPNIYASQYRGFTDELACSLLQALLLLPRISKNSNKILLYDNTHFRFSTLFFKIVDIKGQQFSDSLVYKIITPFVGIAEYSKANEMLLSFQSQDFSLHKMSD